MQHAQLPRGSHARSSKAWVKINVNSSGWLQLDSATSQQQVQLAWKHAALKTHETQAPGYTKPSEPCPEMLQAALHMPLSLPAICMDGVTLQNNTLPKGFGRQGRDRGQAAAKASRLPAEPSRVTRTVLQVTGNSFVCYWFYGQRRLLLQHLYVQALKRALLKTATSGPSAVAYQQLKSWP